MMNTKLFAVLIALTILAIPLSVADLSDAEDSEAIGYKRIRGANVYMSTVKDVEYEPDVYCFVAGSEDDEKMQDFLRNGGSHPSPLMSNVPGEDEYHRYTFGIGTLFVSEENFTFTVKSDGDVTIRMLASSEIKVSAFGYSTEGDAINETIDMNAGDLLIVGGKGPSDFNDLWITVQYDVSNVRIYESESLSETKVLTYVVIGIVALCLIAILVSRRSPLSTKALESIRPSKPVLGKIFAILVVAVIAGAGAYAYMSCPGNDDVDSLEFREGLTVGRTTYQNGELYMKTVYTLGPVEDGMCYCTVKYYNSSGSEIYSDSDIVSIAEFRLIIGYYGSPSELIDLADDDFETARETIDSRIGTVRCDKYIVTDELSTQTIYVYHGMVLRTVTETDDDVITTDLTKIEYA